MMGIVEVVDGDILHISDNRRAASFFGTTPERIQGRWASEMSVPAEVIQHWIRHYEESERTQKPVRFYVHPEPATGADLPCLRPCAGSVPVAMDTFGIHTSLRM